MAINMLLFSHREGIKEVKSIIQINSMDDELRIGLWNAYCSEYAEFNPHYNKTISILFTRLWIDYFKEPIDAFNRNEIYNTIREYFFNCEWNEVYDFIEFVSKAYSDDSVNIEFRKECNLILEREVSAYRFVGKKITQITSETEIAEIEEALQSPLKPVNIHLDRALNLLADRKSRDYRNSIKESISAVEAICCSIVGNSKTTLGQALKKIEKQGKIQLHPALTESFKKLYGWTSDDNGIRHSLLGESNLSFEDAKFRLVSCSGFINYLIAKSSKAGIKLS